MQLQFGGTVGAVAVGGVSVGAGQPAVAQALQMTAGSGSTLESHPALTTLSPEVRVESEGWNDAKEGGGMPRWENGSSDGEEMRWGRRRGRKDRGVEGGRGRGNSMANVSVDQAQAEST